MYHQVFFGATCAGILLAAGLIPLPERESLPEFSLPEVSLAEFSLPDAPEVMASVGAFVADLPDRKARVEETILRPAVTRVSAAVQGRAAPDRPAPAPKSAPVMEAEMVHFDLDTDLLDDAARERLDALARQLADDPAIRLGVFGHTDLTGDEAYNQALGQARAEQVSAYLQTIGIPANRIEVIKSYGETAPMVPTEAPSRENRRVSVKVM